MSYIVRSIEQLASIDLKVSIYCRDMIKYLRIPIASFVSELDTMKMNVAALTSSESEPRMLIEYKLMHKKMLDMATEVVHLVKEIFEVVVVLVCREEDVDILFVIIVTS